MTHRYFHTFPKKPQPDPLYLIRKALKNFQPSETYLHEVFLHPLVWHSSVVPENNLVFGFNESENGLKCPENVLKKNVLQMSQHTKNVSLLMTHFRWTNLLTMNQGRSIIAEPTDVLRAIAIYRILLKKDQQSFNKFINGLYMTGNVAVANAVETTIGIIGQIYENPMVWESDSPVEETHSNIKKRRGLQNSSHENECTSPTSDSVTHFKKLSILVLKKFDDSSKVDHLPETSQKSNKPHENVKGMVLDRVAVADQFESSNREVLPSLHQEVCSKKIVKPLLTNKARNRSSENRFSKLFRLFR